MSTLVAGMLLASLLQAQQDRGTDFMVERLKDRLKLSEDQTARVREILVQDTEERTKLEDARTEKINAVLDADQRKLYEDMRQNTRGFRGGGGGGFQNRAMGTLQIEDAKRDLGLTDEQTEKVKPLYDEFNAGIQKHADELRDRGFQGLNFADEMQKYQESLRVLSEKVKVHLSEDQKAKWNSLMDRSTGWMRMIPTFLRAGSPAQPPPRPTVEERVRAALAGLKIEKEEERSAIGDLVAKIVKAQYTLEDFTKTSRDALSEASRNRDLSDAAVEDRIKEAQDERRKREKDIASLQKQLVEVVTSRQELELMAQGILK